MSAKPHRESPYDSSDERPPWIEEAIDPTHWDVAFGSYGDGYLEWVNTHYYWHIDGPRTTADTRTLWNHRSLYLDDPLITELNAQLPDPTQGSAA